MEAEKTTINWQLMCRICLKSSDSYMKCIFGDSSEESTICSDVVTKISKCGGVPVHIMDGLPDRICDQCLNDLEIAFSFRNTCQESYNQLCKFIKTKNEGEDIKLEAETALEFIKVEAVYNQPASSTEPSSRRASMDIVYTPEESLENAHIDLQPTGDILNDPIKKKIVRKRNRKSRAKSKNEKTSDTRGRKPNPKNKYICHICGNIYDMNSRLSQHIKRHFEEKVHECEICGKKFAATAQISRHMNTHTGNRPYKCKYCPSSFADTSTRNKHQRIHTNERPFKCLTCGKAFAYTNVLKVHMTIHTGERPYSCSVCGKGFSQRHHQQTHERTHINVSGSNTNIQLYK